MTTTKSPKRGAKERPSRAGAAKAADEATAYELAAGRAEALGDVDSAQALSREAKLIRSNRAYARAISRRYSRTSGALRDARSLLHREAPRVELGRVDRTQSNQDRRAVGRVPDERLDAPRVPREPVRTSGRSLVKPRSTPVRPEVRRPAIDRAEITRLTRGETTRRTPDVREPTRTGERVPPRPTDRPPVPPRPPRPPVIPERPPTSGIRLETPQPEETTGRATIPDGSITWKMGGWKLKNASGFWWKYIPPPWTQQKPYSLRQPPVGAKFTDGKTPQDTIQVIGGDRAKVPFSVAVDLGVTDAFVSDYGRSILFQGRGEHTNVGASDPSTRVGMSVTGSEGLGYDRPVMSRKKTVYTVGGGKKTRKNRSSLITAGIAYTF